MKTIQTNGITNINELPGSGGWYWGIDCTGGDLYEAQELYRDGHEICRSRLLFLHSPDGQTAEPVRAERGQYFGVPVMYREQIFLLLADFPAEKIRIFRWMPGAETAECVEELQGHYFL